MSVSEVGSGICLWVYLHFFIVYSCLDPLDTENTVIQVILSRFMALKTCNSGYNFTHNRVDVDKAASSLL